MRAAGTKELIILKLFPSTDLWERIAPVLDQIHLEHELQVDFGQYLSIGGSNMTMHPTSNTPGPEQTITPSLADMPAIRVEDAYRFLFERRLDMLCIAGTDGYFKELNPM